MCKPLDYRNRLNKRITYEYHTSLPRRIGLCDDHAFGNDGGTRKGLIAWYTFDDGTAKDASEFGNHGIVHDVKPAPDRFKRMDAALAFNGRTSWIEVPSSRVYDNLAEITLAVWVCPTDVARGTTRSYNLLSKQPSGSLSQQHGPATSNHGGLFDVNLNFNGEAWEVYFVSQVSPGEIRTLSGPGH